MGRKRIMKALLITLSIVLTAVIGLSETAEAASSKAVKSVSLKIGTQKVTKKTYTLQKGKKVTVKVTANPSKAKKSVTYKSSNKKIVTVSKKGKITAKKTGTAKVTVTVKGKNGKKKSTWMKVKVTTAKKNSSSPQTSNINGHTHKWVNITETKRVYVVDSQAWDEDIYETKCVCAECGFYTDTAAEMGDHLSGTRHGSWGAASVKVDTIHHAAEGHYENKTEVIDRRCSICGILDSQL